MGAYATTTSLPHLLPYSLRGNTTTSDTFGVAMFSKHIDRAEAIVNSFLSGRYSLPLSSVPELIKSITEDIACYYYIRANYVQDGDRKNEYQETFKDALEILKEIKNGKVQLVDSSGNLISPLSSSRYKSNTENYAPIFNLDTETSWELDSDREDDISDERSE